MILCFGTYANILMKSALPGTTNRAMVSALVGTIDPDNAYGDKNNDTSVSRLMNCERNFPVVKVSTSSGPIRSVGGSMTNVVELAKETRPEMVEENFDPVVAMLDEDKKVAAVGALHHLIKNDSSLSGQHRSLFIKCMGDSSAQIVRAYEVNLKSLLARLFLYTVLINNNTDGKETLAFMNNDKGFMDRFQAYAIAFRTHNETSNVLPSGRIPEGVRVYLRKLKEKYDCLPTILHKEAFVPFHDYYVPNDVEWREKIPEERFSYRVRRENDVTLLKLLAISRFLMLTGTGGLGKSMMMRNIILTCVEDYDELGMIPLFIPLKDFNLTYDGLMAYILEMVCNLWPELGKDDLLALLVSGKALLLFDGLDEISSNDLSAFTKQLNGLIDRFSSNAFIMSSRPYSNFQSFTRFTVLQLLPFRLKQALDLVDRFNYRADAPKLQQKFRNMLETTLFYTHQGFSDNPLLLSIMLLTFEMDADVPTLKHIFYQEAFTVLSKRHDASKDGYTRKLKTGWTTAEFEKYFTFFCAVSYDKSDVSFAYSEMEDYFRLICSKYGITGTNVDDFIYDATNSLCIMYQDGPSYGFIHRSFQEYFCAKFFHNQLDEDLKSVIPVFDRNNETKKDDVALPMLYDMKPRAVEKYMIVPYLEDFISYCEKRDGVWTFLLKIYPLYEVADGTAMADDDCILPNSNLYAFILDHYKIPLMNVVPDQLDGISYAEDETWVYREDTKEDVLDYQVPNGYEEYYGEPEVTGHLYRFAWDHIQTTSYAASLKRSIESEGSPFMKEYNSIKELLANLQKKVNDKPRSSNIFDRLS